MKLKVLFTIVFIPVLLLAGNKPNVIVVLADDIGVGDISHYRRIHSNHIILETPNLDHLAASGVVFTQAHSPAALCAPSRYGVMTGNHCYRSNALWGVWGAYEKSQIKDTDLTLGRLMQQAGYYTGFFGKWNLGGDFYRKSNPTQIYRAPRVQPELDVDITKMVDGPNQKGFDYSFTYPEGIQDVPYAVFENGDWMPLGDDSKIVHITQAMMDKINVKLDKDEGLGDSNWDPHHAGPLLANKGVAYIKAHANKKKPFFMYYCSQAVHLPHTPPVELNGVKIAGTTPSPHMDMIKELDVQMGMLMDALKAEGVYNNTVFVFTSDNGGLLVDKQTLASGHKVSSIYRGAKNSKFEGGHRVPFIVSWPDSLSHFTTNEPALTLDIASTLAAITNTKIGSGKALDSYNLYPLLKNEQKATSHSFLMTQSGTGKELILIEDGWKLILSTDSKGVQRNPVDLFDLNTNPQEKEDQNFVNSAAHKARIDAMLAKYNQIRDSKVPTNNMGKLSDTTDQTGGAEVTDEFIAFTSSPNDFGSTDLQFKVHISYAAKENRDISLEIRKPQPDNGFVKNVQVTYPAGAYDTTITLPLNEALAIGNQYSLSLAIKPVGTNWKQNMDEKMAHFNVVNKQSTALQTKHQDSKIYPNPSNGDLNIELKKHHATLQCFDMAGQLCFEENVLGGKATISLAQYLYPGVYLMNIQTQQGNSSHKIIIND